MWAVLCGVKLIVGWSSQTTEPPSNSGVKNEWSRTFTFPLCLHGVFRDKFTFTFTNDVMARDETSAEIQPDIVDISLRNRMVHEVMRLAPHFASFADS
jgi:hypothetical protein